MTLSTLARTGSYSACARELQLTRPTVARRIARLEQALGCQVVLDVAGAVQLSDDGRRVLATATQMEALAADLRHGTDDETVSGQVRITAPEGMAAFLLPAALAPLLVRHPRLQIEVIASNTVLSISHKQADIALRLARPADSELVAIAAGALTYRLYAARTLLDRSDGTTLLRSAPLIGYDASGGRYPEAAALAEHLPARPYALRSGSLIVQVGAARAGAGIALLPDYLAAHYSDLMPLSPAPLLRKEVYLAYHARSRTLARIASTVACLKSALQTSLQTEIK